MKKYASVLVVMAVAAVMAAGIAFGDVGVVWQKAVSVCLECIGVG